jgi:myo-inositol 2-dehydrogenase/D-chiro-inositol 1-dehydrogenase
MLRLGLIGCPDSTAAYARAAGRLRGRFVAVADGDIQTARAAAQALDAEILADSLETLLHEDATAFDAVVIHDPSRFHAPLCQRAAQAGKHLLVEGPLAPSAGAAAEILTACASAGVRLMAGQAFRFLPALQVVKARLDAGRLGEPGLLRIHRWDPLLPTPTHGAGWGATSPLLLDVTREIDLACCFFNQYPTEVHAVGRPTVPSQPGQWAYLQLHLGFAGGGMALLDRARTLPPGDGYFSLSLIGSAGAVHADDHHNAQLLFGRGHPSALITAQGDGLVAQLQEFLAAIEENREPLLPGADGLRALGVAEAAGQSLATGQPLRRIGEHYQSVES